MFRLNVYINASFFFYCVLRMAERELVFEVHYGGKMDRGFMCTYVGVKLDVYSETYDQDKLSFFRLNVLLRNMDTSHEIFSIT
jgi:hypothetical protein